LGTTMTPSIITSTTSSRWSFPHSLAVTFKLLILIKCIKIQDNPRFYPFFKNCLGAIDETHIPISIASEKSLVDILHEYKDSGCRGDNGWTPEGWNKMVKEFHLRNKYVNYTKSQIQDKEGQLKKDYRMLKEARRQSGATWNEDRHMVEGSPSMWDNLEIVS